MSQDISIRFCGIKFPNPFTLAAAPTSDRGDLIKRAFDAGWGGAVCKTIGIDPVHLVYPMIVGIDYESKKLAGMENIDLISERKLSDWVKDIEDVKKHYPNNILIASIMGSSKEVWQELVRAVQDAGADMIECSFSCPHGMPERGMGATVGQNADLTKRTAEWVKSASKIPVVIKLTPNVTDIVSIAMAVKESGCDGVCAINSVKALIGIDLDTFVPIPSVNGKSTYGGYSGPAIKPIALRCVAEIAKSVDIPIAGVGGISNWRDAVEFLLVGATNIQLCTAVMHYGFRIIEDLCDGLKNYLKSKNMKSVDELVGKALPNIVKHEELSRTYKVVSRVNKELCIKDDLCYIACEDGGHQAIKVDSDRYPIISDEKCVGCGLCVAVCPSAGALKLVAF